MSDLKDKVAKLDEQRELRNATKKTKKVKTLVRDKVVDSATGEVLSETTVEQIATPGKEPKFVKFYIQDLILLNDLPTKSSGVLWELVKLTTYGGNKIILNGAVKKDLCNKLGIKMPTLNNNLSSFVKKKILYRLDTGIYMPNPYLFARGEWPDIHDLRMVVDYKQGTKNISLEINGKPAKEINDEIAAAQEQKYQ